MATIQKSQCSPSNNSLNAHGGDRIFVIRNGFGANAYTHGLSQKEKPEKHMKVSMF